MSTGYVLGDRLSGTYFDRDGHPVHFVGHYIGESEDPDEYYQDVHVRCMNGGGILTADEQDVRRVEQPPFETTAHPSYAWYEG